MCWAVVAPLELAGRLLVLHAMSIFLLYSSSMGAGSVPLSSSSSTEQQWPTGWISAG